jgi:hypothetical protein
MASSNANFRAGDDFRKARELEEARKAGLAPAERDEDGKEINPHIPQYMASAPWYLNTTGPVRGPFPAPKASSVWWCFAASRSPPMTTTRHVLRVVAGPAQTTAARIHAFGWRVFLGFCRGCARRVVEGRQSVLNECHSTISLR